MISTQNFKDIFDFKALIQPILLPEYSDKINLALLREDLNHPFIQGNKLRKLKYNLIKARELKQDLLLTFGGAYSNHIAAVAMAAKVFRFKTIGVIRGEELAYKELNPTLIKAKKNGMRFHFISRTEYRKKETESLIKKLKQSFGDFYLIPEGGTNDLAVKGCEEILHKECLQFDIIACPMGTAGTFSGLLNSTKDYQKLLGFSALKNYDFIPTIKKYSNKNNFEIIDEQSFGGFAKWNRKLIDFIDEFEQLNGIKLEPIYTGKMLFGIREAYRSGKLSKDSKVLAIHTGGLQFWDNKKKI